MIIFRPAICLCIYLCYLFLRITFFVVLEPLKCFAPEILTPHQKCAFLYPNSNPTIANNLTLNNPHFLQHKRELPRCLLLLLQSICCFLHVLPLLVVRRIHTYFIFVFYSLWGSNLSLNISLLFNTFSTWNKNRNIYIYFKWDFL